MIAPAFRSAERRSRGARPKLPSLRAVLLEQIRATGLALRPTALIAAALIALLTLFAGSQMLSRGVDITPNAWPTQLPGLMGVLLPIAVWARDDRFGPGFLWTLPLDRRRHALTKVLAGWLWLIGGVALFVLWLIAIGHVSGGRALPPETLYVFTSQVATASPIDPAVLRTVHWAPSRLVWAVVPFTAATACYLLASAFVLGSRHRLRWVVGAVVSYALISIGSEAASAPLRASWLAGAPGRLLWSVVDSRYGLDALLTARVESLSDPAILTTGERIMVWWAVPELADWRIATLLWTGAGLLALWAAVSRHRELRRA